MLLEILSALTRGRLPRYGDGKQIRDWLCVNDDFSVTYYVLEDSKLSETYNVSIFNEYTTLSW